jgi:hypothetical protein
LRDGHLRECGKKKIAALEMGMMWRGMFFTKSGGILFLKLRGKRGMFFYWAGFGRDTGGISQLLRTQLAMIINSAVIEVDKDNFWKS